MLKFFVYVNILIGLNTLVYSKHVPQLKSDSAEEPELESWSGRWFPHPPNIDVDDVNVVADDTCDDGQHSIGIDFDPLNKRDAYTYLCLVANRSQYEPRFSTQTLLQADYIPRAYEPAVICLNETIDYDSNLPTYGPFRPVPPTYGSYTYLPPQRWLHSLAAGAIVMLHHPCANSMQTQMLTELLQACLYRHVITSSPLLSSDRPLALLAWGKSLQMSVVDKNLATDFIKSNAKKGYQQLAAPRDQRKYAAALIQESHLVTDEQDAEMCGYQREM